MQVSERTQSSFQSLGRPHPTTRPPSVLSSKLLKVQIIYFSWLCVIGWIWDALTRWSSTLTLVKGWCEKHGTENMQGKGCKTGGELGNLSCSFHRLLNKDKQTFCRDLPVDSLLILRFRSHFPDEAVLDWGLLTAQVAGERETHYVVCIKDGWLCWAGTAFCLHVGMHMIRSSARRWHLNKV